MIYKHYGHATCTNTDHYHRPARCWSSRITCPDYRKYEPNARSESAAHGLCFRTCYACAGIFEFALDHDKFTYIWAGVPHVGVEYTAISYVRGDVADMIVRCSSCDHVTQFPFLGTTTFVGPERVAGLDAISGLQRDKPGVDRAGFGFLMVTDHRLTD